MAGPSNKVEIVVELQDLASSQILKLEKEIKAALGRVASPTSGTVFYRQQKEDVDQLEISLKKLAATYRNLGPRLEAVRKNLSALTPQQTRAALSLERIAQASLRTQIAEQRLAQAQIRTRMATQRLALATQQVANAKQRYEHATRRAEMSEQRHQRVMAGTTKTAQAAGYSFGRMLTSLSAAITSSGGASGRFFKTLAAGFVSLPAKVAYGVVAFFGMRKAIQAVTNAIQYGLFQVIDDLRLKSLAIAGALKISVPDMPITQAVSQADAVIEKSFALSRLFVGSAREMQVLLQSAATFGVEVDLVTEKGQKQFITFANILKLLTVGQNFEIQAMQEIRAIMQGQNFQGAMLARALQAQGINVAKMGPLWIKQGRFIEEVVTRLGGYAEIVGLIEHTLSSQVKLTESIVALILKGGLKDAYQDVLSLVESINWTLLGTTELTETSKKFVKAIKDAWEDIVDPLVLVVRIVAMMYTFLRKTVGLMIAGAKGIGGIVKQVYDDFVGLFPKAGEFDDTLAGFGDLAVGIGGVGSASKEAKEYTDAFWDMLKRKLPVTWVDEWQERIQRRRDQQKYQGFEPLGLEGEANLDRRKAIFENFAASYDAYLRRLKEFIERQQMDVETALETDSGTVERAVAKARDKVLKSFKKYFDDPMFEEVAKKEPGLIRTLRSLQNQVVGIAEDEAAQKAFEKWLKPYEKFNETFADVMGDAAVKEKDWLDKYLPDETMSAWLNKETAAIDKAINAYIQRLQEAAKATGDERAFEWIRDAVDQLRQIGEEAKKQAADKHAKDVAEHLKAFREETARIRYEASIPVKWPWNEKEVTVLEKMNKAAEELSKGMEKLAKERREGEGTPQDWKDRADALEEAYLEALKKIQEEQDPILQAIAEAWDKIYSAIEDSFSNLFEDVLKGKLKSWKDYMDAFTDAVRKAWANMLAKMLADWIETQYKMTFKTGADQFLSWFGGMLPGFERTSGPWVKGGTMPYSYPGAGIGKYAREGAVWPSFTPLAAFQSGGIVSRPTIGLIGEGPEREAIIPLKGGAVPVQLRGGQGGNQVNINVVAADTRDFDRLLMDRRGMIVGMMVDAMRSASPARDAFRRSM